ncbi:MAG: SocA family protein [Endomicrobium sp.]|jgi:uncharacterized phage-associated protein|nr:SocA family protein [Endomicrobium sp.]
MFLIRKALQTLFYIQSKAPTNNQLRFNTFYLQGIMYFADRYHIRHFGFVASDDKYFATKDAPVALETNKIFYSMLPFPIDLPLVFPVREVRYDSVKIPPQKDDELSESFKQSLDFALATYGKYTQFQLSDISHDYPEWKKHENAIKSGTKSIPMDFIDFFDDPTNLEHSSKNGIHEDPFKDDINFLKTLKEDFCSSHQ